MNQIFKQYRRIVLQQSNCFLPFWRRLLCLILHCYAVQDQAEHRVHGMNKNEGKLTLSCLEPKAPSTGSLSLRSLLLRKSVSEPVLGAFGSKQESVRSLCYSYRRGGFIFAKLSVRAGQACSPLPRQPDVGRERCFVNPEQNRSVSQFLKQKSSTSVVCKSLAFSFVLPIALPGSTFRFAELLSGPFLFTLWQLCTLVTLASLELQTFARSRKPEGSTRNVVATILRSENFCEAKVQASKAKIRGARVLVPAFSLCSSYTKAKRAREQLLSSDVTLRKVLTDFTPLFVSFAKAKLLLVDVLTFASLTFASQKCKCAQASLAHAQTFLRFRSLRTYRKPLGEPNALRASHPRVQSTLRFGLLCTLEQKVCSTFRWARLNLNVLPSTVVSIFRQFCATSCSEKVSTRLAKQEARRKSDEQPNKLDASAVCSASLADRKSWLCASATNSANLLSRTLFPGGGSRKEVQKLRRGPKYSNRVAFRTFLGKTGIKWDQSCKNAAAAPAGLTIATLLAQKGKHLRCLALTGKHLRRLTFVGLPFLLWGAPHPRARVPAVALSRSRSLLLRKSVSESFQKEKPCCLLGFVALRVNVTPEQSSNCPVDTCPCLVSKDFGKSSSYSFFRSLTLLRSKSERDRESATAGTRALGCGAPQSKKVCERSSSAQSNQKMFFSELGALRSTARTSSHTFKTKIVVMPEVRSGYPLLGLKTYLKGSKTLSLFLSHLVLGTSSPHFLALGCGAPQSTPTGHAFAEQKQAKVRSCLSSKRDAGLEDNPNFKQRLYVWGVVMEIKSCRTKLFGYRKAPLGFHRPNGKFSLGSLLRSKSVSSRYAKVGGRAPRGLSLRSKGRLRRPHKPTGFRWNLSSTLFLGVTKVRFGLSSPPLCHNGTYTKYKIIRPLLNLSRENLTILCHDLRLPVYPDKSNLAVQYSRNRLREQILPAIKLFLNPKIDHALFKLAELLTQDFSLVSDLVNTGRRGRSLLARAHPSGEEGLPGT